MTNLSNPLVCYGAARNQEVRTVARSNSAYKFKNSQQKTKSHTNKKTMKIDTWENGWQLWEFIEYLKNIGALGSGYMYRGQRDEAWGVVPGLYRREVHIFGSLPIADRYHSAEEKMIQHFFDRGALLLPNYKRNPILDRIIAQHYGVPTGLLDWTIDPFIAIYFAVQEGHSQTNASLHYILPRLQYASDQPVRLPYNGPIMRITPPILDDRIRTQKSAFTLQSYGPEERFTPLDERQLKYSEEGAASDNRDEVFKFGKVIIPAKCKAQLRYQLLQLGVDSSLTFPGLQGIGERIADYADLSKYGGGFLE